MDSTKQDRSAQVPFRPSSQFFLKSVQPGFQPATARVSDFPQDLQIVAVVEGVLVVLNPRQNSLCRLRGRNSAIQDQETRKAIDPFPAKGRWPQPHFRGKYKLQGINACSTLCASSVSTATRSREVTPCSADQTRLTPADGCNRRQKQ